MKDFIKRVFWTFEPQLEECSSLIYKWASEIAAGIEFLHSKKRTVTSYDSTSELYSCIKGKYQTKLFSQLTNAAEVI
ncbi:hypothetical protein EB796_008126 [Bugula neritina]|uniref:Protein kinase domain-containing protein n=1 Tax=Bugula neritina TaxID=10212 RepID=A0A7J7K5S8_BUGNE|nr:hypothetical protein EB796_008126 [Bugula neritina]